MKIKKYSKNKKQKLKIANNIQKVINLTETVFLSFDSNLSLHLF